VFQYQLHPLVAHTLVQVFIFLAAVGTNSEMLKFSLQEISLFIVPSRSPQNQVEGGLSFVFCHTAVYFYGLATWNQYGCILMLSTSSNIGTFQPLL